MSFESEYGDIMGSIVTVEPFLSTPASDGSTRWDSTNGRIYRARIEQFTKMVRDENGREVVSDTRLYLTPEPLTGAAYSPTANDRFTLPAGYVPQQVGPAISVQRQDDEAGLHHWEVNL